MVILCGLGVLGAAAACEPIDTGAASSGSGQGDDSTGTKGKSAALRQLDSLAVDSWHSMSGYSRDRFPHWRSQGAGCDTRETVLKRQGTGVTTGEECKVTGGKWISPYDNKAFTDPRDLDIDHVVPLANAWRTGADKWTDDARSGFANDLTRPQLLAVTAAQNRSKGDQDPSEWRPALQDYWCEYAQEWIAVKAYYQLFVTAAEKTALEEMLETC